MQSSSERSQAIVHEDLVTTFRLSSQTLQPTARKIFRRRWRRHHLHRQSHRFHTKRTFRKTATSRTTSTRSSRRMTRTAPKAAIRKTLRPTRRTNAKRRREPFSRVHKFSSWSRPSTWKGSSNRNSNAHLAWANKTFSHPNPDTSAHRREPVWLLHSGSPKLKSKSGKFSRLSAFLDLIEF